MKVISWNVNGIRSVFKKDFLKWQTETDADFVCLQEIKAQNQEISSIYPQTNLFGLPKYRLYSNAALKRGYSGVAVFAKQEPLMVRNKLGLDRFDQEGRILELAYPDFTLVNLYLPHGGRQKDKMGYKLEVYDYLLGYLQSLKNKNVILVGDFNVAHEEIDLARPKENQNNTMFTPEERRRLDKIVELDFVDSFRQFHSGGASYSWWPYAVEARNRNLGWRIDYIFVSKNLAPKLKDAFILSEVSGSDHCPVGIDI